MTFKPYIGLRPLDIWVSALGGPVSIEFKEKDRDRSRTISVGTWFHLVDPFFEIISLGPSTWVLIVFKDP